MPKQPERPAPKRRKREKVTLPLDTILELLMERVKERAGLIRDSVRLQNMAAAYVARTGFGYYAKDRDSGEKMAPELREEIWKRAKAFVSAVEKTGAPPTFKPSNIVGEIKSEEALVKYVRGLHLARKEIDDARDNTEASIRDLARALPVWDKWAKKVSGLGELGLGVIVGHLGNPAYYRSQENVWKRLGLALFRDGRRQQRTSGKRPTQELRDEYYYNPQRRADIWSFCSDSLLRAQRREGKPVGAYGVVYDVEKRKIMPRIAATAGLADVSGDDGEAVAHPDKWTKARAHNHAARVMTKALVWDLWRVWHEKSPRHKFVGDPALAEEERDKLLAKLGWQDSSGGEATESLPIAERSERECPSPVI